MIGVLAVTAFILALGALWFTSEAVARVDTRNDSVIRPYLGKINQSIDEKNKTILAMTMRIEQLERDFRLLQLKVDLPSAAERKAAAVQPGPEDLKRFTPTIRLTG